MSFPRYPKYKPSGVEWLGEVPEHWEVKRIGHVGRLQNGLSIGGEAFGTGDAFVSYGDVYNNAVLPTAPIGLVQSSLEDQRKCGVEAGDVLFTRTSESADDIGVASTCTQTIPRSTFAGFLIRFRPEPRTLESEFTVYLFRNRAVSRHFAGTMNIVTRASLSQGELRSLPICLPPLPEQRAIAAFLDRETAKIDGLVAEQQRLIELLKEKRQAVISHAVTKGLDPKAPMKPSGVEWLGEVPAHWEVRRLRQISPQLAVGIVVNPSSVVSEVGLPFIYGGDIREEEIDWEGCRKISPTDSARHAKTQLHPGDLLTVRVGAPGVTAVVPEQCAGGNCASVMLIRQGSFDSHWLCYVMNSRIVRYQVEQVQYGAAQEQFNISHAVDFWIPVPPALEQKRIAIELQCQCDRLRSLATAAASAITLLQERRSALISAAVTGQIDVRNAVATEAA